MSESMSAEIIWFVRGTTLYRRVLLIDEHNNCTTTNYASNDVSFRDNGGTPIPNNQMLNLVRRENRFAHSGGTFPFPLYNNNNEAWYYLRMPTLEETVHSTWHVGQQLPVLGALSNLKMNGDSIPTTPSTTPYWDFWENPNGLNGQISSLPTQPWQQDSRTGSINLLVETPRNPRAGEDIVLKNVISFDVKVWNKYWVPCSPLDSELTPPTVYWAPPQYVDLGQDQLSCIDGIIRPVNYTHNLLTPLGTPVGYGFTLKGRYNTSTNNRRTVADATDKWHKAERLNLNGTNSNILWTGPPLTVPPMPCVFDSWTFQYQSPYTSDPDYVVGEPSTWRYPPPYTEDLQSIQITIRCFEPQSGNIKQVRVVQSF
jgi:hypothetical protein